MKAQYLFLGLLFVLSACSEKPEDSAINLFNGEDLTGWDGNLEYWRAEDGMIVGQFTEMSRNHFLYHEKEVEDFRLTLQVRVVGGHGNSGIQFRSEVQPDGHVKGPQADIGDGYWGKLYDELGRGWLWEDESCEQYADKDAWNEYEVLTVGNNIRTAINGHLCVDLEDPEIPSKGIIALQLHAFWAPAEIQFRDIELELDPEFRLTTVD